MENGSKTFESLKDLRFVDFVYIFFFLIFPIAIYLTASYFYKQNIRDNVNSCLSIEEECLQLENRQACAANRLCRWHESEHICCFVGNYAMEKLLGGTNCCPKEELCN